MVSCFCKFMLHILKRMVRISLGERQYYTRSMVSSLPRNQGENIPALSPESVHLTD